MAKYLSGVAFFMIGVVSGWMLRSVDLTRENVEVIEPFSQVVLENSHGDLATVQLWQPMASVTNTLGLSSMQGMVLYFLQNRQFDFLEKTLLEQSYTNQQSLRHILYDHLTIAFAGAQDESAQQQLEAVYLSVYGEDGWWSLWQGESALDAKDFMRAVRFGEQALRSADLSPVQLTQAEATTQKAVRQLLEQQLKQQSANHPLLAEFAMLLQQLVSSRGANTSFQYDYARLLIRLGDYVTAQYYLQNLQYDQQYKQSVWDLLNKIDLLKQGGKQIQMARLGEHYLVVMTIELQMQTKLLLDTGASMTVIAQEVLAKLPQGSYKLVESNSVFNTANGQVRGNIYELSQIEVFGYRLANVKVAVLPMSGREYQGLLGMNILQLFEFELNQQHAQLRLKPKSNL